MEVASRLMTFAGKRHLAWRLGGDEFAVLLREVRSEAEVQALCRALTEQFLPPFNLHNGHSATLSLSVGYARRGSTPPRNHCKNLPIRICIG